MRIFGLRRSESEHIAMRMLSSVFTALERIKIKLAVIVY